MPGVFLLGPYALDGMLSESASARVFSARRTDGALPGPLACKLYSRVDDGFAQGMTERARGLLALACPGHVTVFDVGRMGTQLVVVRPRLRAFTVAELVERSRRNRRTVPQGVAVRIVLDLLAALAVAHGWKHPTGGEGWLVHGEVIPDHVLVDETGRVMLLGLETPRSPAGRVLPVRLDLSAACALLYDLMNPRFRGEMLSGPAMPPEVGALLTRAMGLGAAITTAATLRDALLDAARAASVTPANADEMSAFIRRTSEAGPPRAFGALAPISTPPAGAVAAPDLPPAPAPAPAPEPVIPASAAPPGGMFAAPRPVSGLINVPSVPRRARIGDVLVRRGFAAPAAVEAAVQRQRVTGQRLGEVLLDEGTITDVQLADALAELAMVARLPDDELLRMPINPGWVGAMPEGLRARGVMVPVDLRADGIVVVATSDPFDATAAELIQRAVGANGISLRIAAATAVRQAVARAAEAYSAETSHRDPRPSSAPRPVSAPDLAPVPEAAATLVEGTGDAQVLVCEPDAPLAASLQARFQSEGWGVHLVGDGQQARQFLERTPVDAVLAEAALPRVDGLSLLLGVRSRDATREVPFFIISARFDEKQSAKAMDLGADDFLPKPVNLEMLVGKLKRAIAKHRALLESQRTAEEQRRRAEEAARNPPAGRPAADAPPPRAEPTGVIGSLKQMGLPEVVQSLEMGRRTAVVSLMIPGLGEGSIWLHEGEVINCTLGEKRGEEVFYAMARHRDGFFRIHYGDPPSTERIIAVSTTYLLLEAMRRIDEEAAP